MCSIPAIVSNYLFTMSGSKFATPSNNKRSKLSLSGKNDSFALTLNDQEKAMTVEEYLQHFLRKCIQDAEDAVEQSEDLLLHEFKL